MLIFRKNKKKWEKGIRCLVPRSPGEVEPVLRSLGEVERRVRDSNPGTSLKVNGFQDRRIQPLCQLSAGTPIVSKTHRGVNQKIVQCSMFNVSFFNEQEALLKSYVFQL